MGRNQYWAGRVYDLCVYYMTGTPEGSTESGFMEKPGFEPATPGLQGIALIHYTTGACVGIPARVSHMCIFVGDTVMLLGAVANRWVLKLYLWSE